ncbi:MAG: prolipoprotein diacylglyceryl transferase [Bacteroidota bacterium]|nr:prolipoprotein diacylglyceryl transferase [Bacteroidota bacterium]
MLHYITWDPDPELIRIGSFAIRWYGLLFASGFIFGYFFMLRIFKNEDKTSKLLDQLATYMVIATVIGARLGHCLFYEPEYYLDNPLEILMIWKGGLASHGAAIAIAFALYFFSKKNKLPVIWVFDRIAIVVALAGFFIRIGNLMNSEIYGKASDLPWAFIYAKDDLIPRHPTQIYEALSYLLIFVFLYTFYWKKKGNPKPGFLLGMFMILVFTARFLIEFLKEPQVSFEQEMFLNMGQLLSIPFVLIGLIAVFRPVKKTEKKEAPAQ